MPGDHALPRVRRQLAAIETTPRRCRRRVERLDATHKENRMTPDEIAALFLRAQSLLHIVDNRMTLLPLRDMETLTKLCGLVAEQPEDTPVQCALVRLAATTAAVLTTSVVDGPDNAEIVAAWRTARREHEALQSL
jgi:hypothetical protein